MYRSASRELAIALACGVVAAVVVGLLYRFSIAPLTGFDVAALIYLLAVWLRIWSLDAEETAAHAAREDPTRATADLVLLAASVVSLAAVVVLLLRSHSSGGTVQSVEVGIAAVSVVMAWLVVHTLFTLKYARLYYRPGDNEQGVDFENAVRPPYTDFAYLSFTIGMTFQVSDTDLQSAEFRALALRHALLSYLFGAIILASMINLVASLLS